jgi:hypothetical protein
MEEACGSVTSTHSGLCTTESGIGQSEDIVLIYTCNPFPALQVKETELIIPPPFLYLYVPITAVFFFFQENKSLYC